MQKGQAIGYFRFTKIVQILFTNTNQNFLSWN